MLRQRKNGLLKERNRIILNDLLRKERKKRKVDHKEGKRSPIETDEITEAEEKLTQEVLEEMTTGVIGIEEMREETITMIQEMPGVIEIETEENTEMILVCMEESRTEMPQEATDVKETMKEDLDRGQATEEDKKVQNG